MTYDCLACWHQLSDLGLQQIEVILGSLCLTCIAAESFGTLLQNYTPASSLSAPSIDDVIAGLPNVGLGRDIVASPARSPPNEVRL